MTIATRVFLALLLGGISIAQSSAHSTTTSPDATSDKPLMLASQARTPTSPPQADPASVQMTTDVTRIPQGAFIEDSRLNARQLRALRGAGISTARDLLEAEPVALGRLLDIQPRQASMAQDRLRGYVMQRSPASRPASPEAAPTGRFGMNSSVREIPSGSFIDSGRLRNTQISALEGAGINTVRDLLDAEPVALGRLLGIQPRQASMAQQRLQTHLQENRTPASRPAASTGRFGLNSSVREIPGDSFVDGGRLRNTQISALEGAGINTVRDLLGAEPVALGRLLGIQPRQASMAQQRLQTYMRENRSP
ncbi:MAG: hypothetical protein JJU31_02870 [Wenzhouxiangella sp.]|nr:hypothetical protein [Wenzhouxiangella sp.]MCH8478478.1 hypothetical protein [Wenzhouxiangella sp.]